MRRSAFDLLSRPGITIAGLVAIWPELARIAPLLAERLQTDAVYSVYLDRQDRDLAAYRRDEAIRLPSDLLYGDLAGLSNELRQKLEDIRPATLGHAARVEGITPAALTLLAAHARGRRPGRVARNTAATVQDDSGVNG